MDDFREWISDYLRYFELGAVILAAVLLLVFGIRFLRSGSVLSGQTEDAVTKEAVSASDKEQQELPAETLQEVVEDAPEVSGSRSQTVPSLVEADSQISALIRDYYKAIGEQDVETIQKLVEDLAPEDEPAVLHSRFVDYQLDHVYALNGLTDDAKAVLAVYSYRVDYLDTRIPSSSLLYIVKDVYGGWRIDGDSSQDKQISSYLDSLSEDPEIAEVIANVASAYSTALSSDPDLSDYLLDLGSLASDDDYDNAGHDLEGSESEESGSWSDSSDEPQEEDEHDSDSSDSDQNDDAEAEEEDKTEEEPDDGSYPLVANDNINVRDSAGGGSVIGQIEAGQTVHAYGTVGEWTEIRFEGGRAYVYSDFVQ